MLVDGTDFPHCRMNPLCVDIQHAIKSKGFGSGPSEKIKIMTRGKRQLLQNSVIFSEASIAIKGGKHPLISRPVPRLGMKSLHCT